MSASRGDAIGGTGQTHRSGPDNDADAIAASEVTADRLITQGRDDRQSVDDLRARAIVDHQLIAELEAAGAADRATIGHLETALASARRIGAAVGIVMATRKVTDEQAIDLLKHASQEKNLKLRELAERVLLTGEMP